MLSLNYFIHSSWQLHYYYPTLGIDRTLWLFLAEMGFEPDCVAPKYSRWPDFCSVPHRRAAAARIPFTEEKNEAPERVCSVRAQTKCFTSLAHFVFTTFLRGGISPTSSKEEREPEKGGGGPWRCMWKWQRGVKALEEEQAWLPLLPAYRPLVDFPIL